jgi:FkbM family methyltransferase
MRHGLAWKLLNFGCLFTNTGGIMLHALRTSYKDSGISYINALVSDREEQSIFYEYVYKGCEQGTGISSLLKRDVRYNHHKQAKIMRSTVNSIRGDTLIENKFKNRKRISLWIDVEGCQYEVFNSLATSFEREIITSVYIEVEKVKLWPEQRMLENDIIEFMSKHNFSPFLRDKEYPMQYNIIFVNNNIKYFNFSLYLDYYRMSLLKQCRLLQ